MKKHYETHVEDTDKLISVAGPVLDYKSWYERYRKLMEEQAQRKYGLYTPTSEGDDDFPSIPGMIARYSAKGLTNEQMAANPVWVDKTGNGHDLRMKNFAWSGMSGVGGYTQNYNYSAWRLALDRAETTKTGHSFNVTSVTSTVVAFYYQSGSGQEPFTVKSQIVRVSGLTDGQSIKYRTGVKSLLVIESDGIYTLPPFDFAAKGTWYGFVFGKIQESCNITIEQLPLYPGFILGDGVDDFAVTEKELNFEDTYTVYTAFIPFQNNPKRNMILCGADSKKTFSMQYSSLVYVSFIAGNNYYINANFVNGLNLFACKRNGNNMYIKNLLTNKVVTGTCGDWVENAGLYYLWNNATYRSLARAAIAGQTICNGYFSTDEDDEKVLNWYKKQYPWLFPDQAWTVTGKTNEDTDRATIANITGNGNNLVLSNFGFAGNSGYGEYAYNWKTWKINKVDSTKSNTYHNRMEITLPAIGDSSHTQCNFYSPLCEVGTIYDFSFKISGLTGNSTVLVKPGTNGGGDVIARYNKDGVYHLNYTLTEEAIVGESTQNRIYFFIQNLSDEEMNLTIEQIPDHEGYLVTDGVDDYVRSSNNFTLGKKFTVVGEWELLDNTTVLSGIAKNTDFFLYSNINGLSFYCKQDNLPTVFNGIKSLTAFNSEGLAYDHKWEKYVCEKTGDKAPKTTCFIIGNHNNTFAKVAFKNMAMYAEKVLSKEDMIKAYIYLQTLKAK